MIPLIAPSILSADFGRLAEEVESAEAGGADWIHVDVMDGHFVPNITMGPAITAATRRATSLPLDVHLMIEDPHHYIEAFVEAGADVVTLHAEACPHLHRCLQAVRAAGAKAGVALNPGTPVGALADVVEVLDLVLIMSVNPGFGGQAFIPHSLEKVRDVRTLLDEVASSALIEVDGGVGETNAKALVEAGADVLVAGSAVFGHRDGARAGIASIREALTVG
ncbi:MAG: ribulose-phosphate 3-epimerase [Longimicrobiales bacterium]|nr:ribulose-phosphate 3-epimerase [Longimicrobiales bacterium]